MNTRFLTANLVLATLVIVGAHVVHAQDGVQGAVEDFNRTASPGQILRFSSPTLAIADFDGDNKPDGAILVQPDAVLGQGNFEIKLHLTGHNNGEIKFQSLESALTVEAFDIDHDGDIDLIIEESISHKRVQVWINDGHGHFEKGRLEDFPSEDPVRDQLGSSEHVDVPSLFLPTQRGFETLLIACHIAGRPPSKKKFTSQSTNFFTDNQAFSLIPSRAPPLS